MTSIFYSKRFLFKPLLMVIFVCSTSLLFISGQAFAKVTATLNQESYYLGDIISLNIETDKNQNTDPDLSVLQSDFDVKGSSASSQINIINGNRSYRKKWNIELQAKKTGQFTIPEIKLGDEKTEAIQINIKKLPPEVLAETSKHIFIESSVDLGSNNDNEIYVQQQIPYTVKFFYDAAMRTGEVVLPNIENANIRVVGREKKYEVVRAGNKYVVVERRYVISPEKSGKLFIPPTLVQGRIALTGGDSPQLRKRMDEVDMLNELFSDINNGSTFSNPFDPFFSRRSIGPTRPFTAASESIEVNVLPVPDSFTGAAWLPAEEIKMQDSWTENPPSLQIGEPVTRTIIMQVKGLASSQIPEIVIPKPAGMKVYPELSKTETPNDGNTIYGIQRVDISYIPNKAGYVVIPEINIDWWDVKNKQQQTYTLPEWNLNVAAATDSSKVSDAVTETEVMQDVNPEAESEASTVDHLTLLPSYWRWEILFLLFIAIAIFLWFLNYIRKRFLLSPRRKLRNIKRKDIIEGRAIHASLLKACVANDNQKAADLLIKHVNYLFEDSKIQNLGAVATKLKHGAEVINLLETSLYSKNTQDWRGDDLHKLVRQGLQAKKKKKSHSKSVIAPLYPN